MEQPYVDPVRKLAEVIQGIKVAMLTTVCEDGTLRSRPMATQDHEFDGTLWFFTRDDTAKVSEVRREEHVNLSYVDANSHRYVSVSGRATLSRDHQKMATLWTPAHRAFFPQGLDEPEIALLRVEVDSAEYWDSPGGVLVKLVGFMTALAGRPQVPGESHKLEISGKTAHV